jgi:DNA-binding NarL/FixJ family response regulator
MLKAAAEEELEARLVLQGEMLKPPGLPGSLSQRQQQVLSGVKLGMANKQIASELHISERTVKFHVSDLLRKFGVTSRQELKF